MDVPPAYCLRSRRSRGANGTDVAFAPRGRGKDSVSSLDADNRLGSLTTHHTHLPNDGEAHGQKEVESFKAQEIITGAQPETQTENNSDRTELQSTTSIQTSKPKSALVKTPKQLLNEFYTKLKVKSSTKDQYTTVKHDKIVRFTSVFTCQITWERFMSGRLKGMDFLEEDGAVWYSK